MTVTIPGKPLPRVRAREVQPKYRSGLEADYASHLELRLKAGDIREWRYEPFKLRLADGTYYTPDFVVVNVSGFIDVIEAKGFMREAARVRLRVAADQFRWFKFSVVRRERGQWTHEEIGA